MRKVLLVGSGQNPQPEFSIIIPYQQRPENLDLCLSALADQTIDTQNVQVVIGAMEYDTEFISIIRRHLDRLEVVSVLTADPWNLSRSRNYAIRQATGRILVFLDVDMVLPPRFLQTLLERYYPDDRSVCVAGRMLGYDEVDGTDVAVVEVLSYAHYRQRLLELAADPASWLDNRWAAADRATVAKFPWVFARGGLLSIPRCTVEEQQLFFDEGFQGWGPEDQEWALRVVRSGTPVVLGGEVFGLHLPHIRPSASNDASAWRNNRYYLAKWPRLELELALGMGGWRAAAELIDDATAELARQVRPGCRWSVAQGSAAGISRLMVGLELDERGELTEPLPAALFDTAEPLVLRPLVGLALPLADTEVDEVLLTDRVGALPPEYQHCIRSEASRVGRRVFDATAHSVA